MQPYMSQKKHAVQCYFPSTYLARGGTDKDRDLLHKHKIDAHLSVFVLLHCSHHLHLLYSFMPAIANGEGMV